MDECSQSTHFTLSQVLPRIRWVHHWTAPQTPEWVADDGGSDHDLASQVTVRADGSVLTCGAFSGMAAIAGTTPVSNGAFDILVAALDSNGSWLWASRAGGTGDDQCHGLVSQTNGDAVIMGSFHNTTDFGSTTLDAVYRSDIHVAGLDAGGNWTWATSAGSTGSDALCDVVTRPMVASSQQGGSMAPPISQALRSTRTAAPVCSSPGSTPRTAVRRRISSQRGGGAAAVDVLQRGAGSWWFVLGLAILGCIGWSSWSTWRQRRGGSDPGEPRF